MENYEDWLAEAVRMLHEHDGRREPVARALRERVAQDRELQFVLLGEELPGGSAARLPEKAINGIYDLAD
ncbi:MAG: hypothetical protein U5K43_02310 [Halofilum sp. (in: g-proteobacteria)]|nr:hypothetical protein [Halofilum sp. (in: g-proteobacteria)]